MRNGDNPQAWFKMPVQFHLDEEMIRLSTNGQLLFIKIVALCAGLRNGGVLAAQQVLMLASHVSRPKDLVHSLVVADVLQSLTFDPLQHQNRGMFTPLQHQNRGMFTPLEHQSYVRRTSLEHQNRGMFTPLQHQWYVITNATKWLFLNDREPTVNAGRPTESIPDASMRPPRAPARARVPVVEERKKEEEPPRPATPDGRGGSAARNAGRGGEGTPRPAPQDQSQSHPAGVVESDDGGDSLVGLENLSGAQLATAALNRGKANSKYTTGRDVEVIPPRWSARNRGRAEESETPPSKAMDILSEMLEKQAAETNPSTNGEG